MNTIPKVSTIFPQHVRRELIAASQLDRHLGPGESKDRAIAVDSAIGLARRECPKLFNNDKE